MSKAKKVSYLLSLILIAPIASAQEERHLSEYSYFGMNAGAILDFSKYHTEARCPAIADNAPFCDQGESADNGTAVENTGSRVFKLSGAHTSVFLGHHWKTKDLIWGFEADFGAFDLNKSVATKGNFPINFLGNEYTIRSSVSTNWLGTARGRLGTIVKPKLLIYTTAGLAFTDLQISWDYADDAISDEFPGGTGHRKQSKIDLGWTIGAGSEWQLNESIALKAEYLYLDFKTRHFHVPVSNTAAFTQSPQIGANLKAHLLRFGFSRRF